MKPGRGLFYAALGFLALGTAAFFSAPLYLVWFFAGCTALPLIVVDALLLLLLTGRLETDRSLPASLAQDEPVRVRLRVRRNGGPLIPPGILLYDLYPSSMSC